MKSSLFLVIFSVLSLSTFSVARAHSLSCVVSLIDGENLQDFVAPQTSVSQYETKYSLVHSSGFTFNAIESVDSDILNLQIINAEKMHLGTSPVLQKGQRACLTVDLGLNEKNQSKKVSISCVAL